MSDERLIQVEDLAIAAELVELLELRGSPALRLDEFVSPVVIVGQLGGTSSADEFLANDVEDYQLRVLLYNRISVVAFSAATGYAGLRNTMTAGLLVVTSIYVQSGVGQQWEAKTHQPPFAMAPAVSSVGTRRDTRAPVLADLFAISRTDVNAPAGEVAATWDTTGMLDAIRTEIILRPDAALTVNPIANTQTYRVGFEYELRRR